MLPCRYLRKITRIFTAGPLGVTPSVSSLLEEKISYNLHEVPPS